MVGQSGILNMNMALPDSIKVDAGGGDDSVANEFFMYVFKVQPCPKRGAHDWSSCPYAHPKEKARRRDPRVYSYASTPCPESLQGVSCGRGVGCPYAHSVYEYWLHPARFRTQMCKKGNQCNRTLCFFAHSASELRFPETSDDAEAAALDAAAASAGVLPLVPAPTSTVVQLARQGSTSNGNSGVLLQGSMLSMGQVCDISTSSAGGGSLVGHSTGSFAMSQRELGFAMGGSDSCLRLPGVAVGPDSRSISDPLPALAGDGSNNAAWLQLAAASQLPASQILSSIRPPPVQQQQVGMMAAGGYAGPAQQQYGAGAATSNAALTMQRLAVPGANVMGIISGAAGMDASSPDQVAAGMASLQLGGNGGAAAGPHLLVDDNSSSSCITSASGDHQAYLAALGLAHTHSYDVNGRLVQHQHQQHLGSARPSPAKRPSAGMDELLLLQQNLMRMNSGTSSMSMSGLSSSGGSIPGLFGTSGMPQQPQGGGSWMRIG